MGTSESIMKWLLKKGALGGIARSLYSNYKQFQKECPGFTESEIYEALFIGRFSILKLRRKEQERYDHYLENNDPPTNLLDVCLAIAEIELDIYSSEPKYTKLAVEVLYEELERLGWPKE